MSITISLSTITKSKRIYQTYPKQEARERIITLLHNDSNSLTRGQCTSISNYIINTLTSIIK